MQLVEDLQQTSEGGYCSHCQNINSQGPMNTLTDQKETATYSKLI
jgi:hypothetical protein